MVSRTTRTIRSIGSILTAIAVTCALAPAAATATDQIEVLLAARPADGRPLDMATMEALRLAIERRLDGLGFTAYRIEVKSGGRVRVVVPAAAVENPRELVEVLSRTGLLELIDPRGALLAPGTIVTTTLGGPTGAATPAAGTPAPAPVYETIVSGDDVAYARPVRNGLGTLTVGFVLAPDAAARFLAWTSAHLGEPLAIVLDKVVVSAPVVQAPIADRGVIDGIPEDEVAGLIVVLNAKPLPVPLEVVAIRPVGAATPAAGP